VLCPVGSSGDYSGLLAFKKKRNGYALLVVVIFAWFIDKMTVKHARSAWVFGSGSLWKFIIMFDKL
jgi:hypothetical protein